MRGQELEDLLVERSFETELLTFMMLGAIVAVFGFVLFIQLRRYLRHRAARQRWLRRMAGGRHVTRTR